jgi:hypothetical protein
MRDMLQVKETKELVSGGTARERVKKFSKREPVHTMPIVSGMRMVTAQANRLALFNPFYELESLGMNSFLSFSR